MLHEAKERVEQLTGETKNRFVHGLVEVMRRYLPIIPDMIFTVGMDNGLTRVSYSIERPRSGAELKELELRMRYPIGMDLSQIEVNEMYLERKARPKNV